MELAASFFYISAGLAIWIIGALVTVILIELVKTLKSIQQTSDNLKNSIASLDAWKSVVAGAITSAITGFVSKKTKGGGDRASDQKN